jgi:hypothetical protein
MAVKTTKKTVLVEVDTLHWASPYVTVEDASWGRPTIVFHGEYEEGCNVRVALSEEHVRDLIAELETALSSLAQKRLDTQPSAPHTDSKD